MDTSKMELIQQVKYKKPFDDVTAEKTAKIEHLKRLVEDAKKQLAESEAAYASFQEKEELFTELLSKAENKLSVMTAQDNLAVDASQKVKSLYKTTEIAITTADDTYIDVKNLLGRVQKVVDATLDAATQITLTAEFIMSRKFSNPLISSQLVADASQAATDANNAVTLIINTLSSTFNALSTSNQAKNTAGIVQVELVYLVDLLVSSLDNATTNTNDETVEDTIKSIYDESRDLEKEAQKALDEVNQATTQAKNQMIRATADLVNTEAALNAAEAAAGS